MGTKQQVQDGRIDMPDLVVSAIASVRPSGSTRRLPICPPTRPGQAACMTRRTSGSARWKPRPGPRSSGRSSEAGAMTRWGRSRTARSSPRRRALSVFEFVTEGHLEPKKQGKAACDTRITYRFEIAPEGTGSSITYRVHISKWTNAPAVLRSAVLRPIARLATKSYAKRMLRNLTTYATQH